MKSKRLIKKVPAELDVLHFPAPDERPFGALCSNCSVNLSLSQPDLYSPDRLIGVCERCKYWFLIDLIPNQGARVLWRLPDIETIRCLCLENSSEQISDKSTKREE
jgi:hypothetical protein